MAGKLRVPRSRGALTGMLLILLGAWGALIPFIGPYFHYAYTPDNAWTYTTGRLWLEILPGLGAVVGGLILLVTTWRPLAILGAWLALVSGAWFAIGSALAPLWTHANLIGVPGGGTVDRAVEQIGFFAGLGIVLAVVAAVAIGRLSVLAAPGGRRVTAASAPASRRPSGIELLRRAAIGKRPASRGPASHDDSAQPAGITP